MGVLAEWLERVVFFSFPFLRSCLYPSIWLPSPLSPPCHPPSRLPSPLWVLKHSPFIPIEKMRALRAILGTLCLPQYSFPLHVRVCPNGSPHVCSDFQRAPRYPRPPKLGNTPWPRPSLLLFPCPLLVALPNGRPSFSSVRLMLDVSFPPRLFIFSE